MADQPLLIEALHSALPYHIYIELHIVLPSYPGSNLHIHKKGRTDLMHVLF